MYRMTVRVSANPQLGGPELRLRLHTDDFRIAWYTYYVPSFTAGESALPPETGADYPLYFNLPYASQPGHMSFDLIDFENFIGGTLAVHELMLDSRPY